MLVTADKDLKQIENQYTMLSWIFMKDTSRMTFLYKGAKQPDNDIIISLEP
jgi:hypothetical protein